MTRPLSPRDLEQLSAFLDDQLSARERQELNARLQQDPPLNAMLRDLRRTRALLRSTPRPRVPRNYTLTPQMAAQIRSPRRLPFWQQAPAWAWTSALASLLLVAFLLGDLWGVFSQQQATAMQALSPAAESAPLATGFAEVEQQVQRSTTTEDAPLAFQQDTTATPEAGGSGGGGLGAGGAGSAEPFPLTETPAFIAPVSDQAMQSTADAAAAAVASNQEVTATFKTAGEENPTMELPAEAPQPKAAVYAWVRWLEALLLLLAMAAGVAAWRLARRQG